MVTKYIKGKGLWVLAAVLLIGAGLLTTGVYAAGLTVKAHPLQNTGANRQITYSPTWSSAAAIVTRGESSVLTLNGSDQVTSVTVGGTKASGCVNVKVDLLNAAASILDTATVAIQTVAGTYSQVVTLPLGTVAYRNVAKVSAAYTATAVPIAFDAASSFSAKAASLTWAHTVGAAGTNRILIVGVSYRTGGTSITGVTYGGQSLTFIGGISVTGGRVELWYIVAPLTGTNDVVVSGTGKKEKIAGATSWTGVHQTTPLGAAAFATGTSITPSVNVTSATGEVVVDTVEATDSASLAVGGAQTQWWNVSQGSYLGGGSSESGAATTTMSWTLSGSFDWSIGAVPLKQAQP